VKCAATEPTLDAHQILKFVNDGLQFFATPGLPGRSDGFQVSLEQRSFDDPENQRKRLDMKGKTAPQHLPFEVFVSAPMNGAVGFPQIFKLGQVLRHR